MNSIGLQSEYVLSIGEFMITNTFLTSVLVTFLLVAFSILFYPDERMISTKIYMIVRYLMFGLLNLINTVTQDETLTQQILPLIATFFLFIVSANLLALIPGYLGAFYIKTPTGNIPLLRSPNSDLTTTLALALFSVGAIQLFSFKTLGLSKYLRRFFNFINPIKFVLGFFELLSELVKILSFSFRLFGNIFAGEVLLLVIAFLAPYIIPVPFMIMEVFMGIIQAFIFAVLTLTFIKTSTLDDESK